jgi:hypothetical protein
MEYSALLVFFLCEISAAIFVYFNWLRNRSGLTIAKAELVKAVRDHSHNETLEPYIQNVANGEISLVPKRKWLMPYLTVFLSGVLGFLIILCMKFLTGAGVVLRTMVGTLAMLPFTWLLAVEISKEADDNRIVNYERSTARLVLEKTKEGATSEQILDLLQ